MGWLKSNLYPPPPLNFYNSAHIRPVANYLSDRGIFTQGGWGEEQPPKVGIIPLV